MSPASTNVTTFINTRPPGLGILLPACKFYIMTMQDHYQKLLVLLSWSIVLKILLL